MNLNNGDNQHIQINRSTVIITKHDTESQQNSKIKENTKTAVKCIMSHCMLGAMDEF